MKYYACIVCLVIPFLSPGQLLEIKAVLKLPNSVNSDVEESMPLLSPDGKTLYFSRILDPENIGGVYSGSDVWTSRKDVVTRRWGKAGNEQLNINTKGNNTVVGMNKDGSTLYVMNTSPGKAPKGIYFIRKFGQAWSKPELIRIPDLSTDGFLGMFVSSDFDVIFLSMKAQDGYGEEDLYITTRDNVGHWSKPANLGATINTKGFEISPFLSTNKKRLYFASNGHPGLGDADVFYSDRLYDSWETWSTPRNMGEQINSKSFDAYFSLYGDSVGYFTSNRSGKLADIYSASLAITFIKDDVAKYLTQAEVAELVGSATMEIRFDKGASGLKASQNELLFYIVNKIVTRADIKLQLVMNDVQANELNAERIQTLSDKLKSLGLSGYRVEIANVPNGKRDNTLPDGAIRIMLFR
jgi:hypothetical protein